METIDSNVYRPADRAAAAVAAAAPTIRGCGTRRGPGEPARPAGAGGTGPRARHRTYRAALLGLLGLLGLALLARGPRPGPGFAARTILVGHNPVALALATRTARLFVANYGDASVSMLDAHTGAPLATITVPSHPSVLAAAAQARRILVAGDSSVSPGQGSLSALDAASGRVRWTRALGHGIVALAVAEPTGRAFVADSIDGRVRLLAVTSGRLLHTVTLPGFPVALALDARRGRVYVVSHEPERTDGIVPGLVSVLDARTGTVLRTVAVGDEPSALALDARRARVFVVNAAASSVSTLDARTGTVLRTQPVGLWPAALAVSARTGRVVVASAYAATVSLLDPAGGRVAHTIAVGAPAWAVAVDARTDRIIVLGDPGLSARARIPARGALRVLDGRTGRVLQRTPVGLWPSALAVDARSGRVFVGNRAGTPFSPDVGQRMLSWGRRWLPWLPRPSPLPLPRTGSVSMLTLPR